MEWSMPANEYLKDEITKLNYTLIPPGFQGDVKAVRMMQDSLAKVIDYLGDLSTRAQGVNKVITSSEKMRNAPNHVLYLLKDAQGNSGKGQVIGLLKVGYKKLFLFDRCDKVLEVEPLCVLDFFVLPTRQRQGNGRKLFDYMMQDLNVTPQQMAIDGPSDKMLKFLEHNYNMKDLVRQPNNFAVAPEFFQNNAAKKTSNRSTPQLISHIGRYTAPRPNSTIGSVIHGPVNGSIATGASNVPSATASPRPSIEEQMIEATESLPLERPSSLNIDTYEDEIDAPIPDTLSLAAICPLPTPTPLHTPLPSDGVMAAGATISRRDSQVTDQGFFDIKFYHNKLW